MVSPSSTQALEQRDKRIARRLAAQPLDKIGLELLLNPANIPDQLLALGGEEQGVRAAVAFRPTPLDEAASTIPTSPAMLPLIDRLTGAWSAAAAASPGLTPGESVLLPNDADALLLPDGIREPVTGGSSYGAANEPGVYHVLAGTDTLTAFAVNSPRAESDLSRLGERELGAWIGDAAVTTVSNADDWADTVYRHRLGAESWRPFALFALLLLLVEPLLAASGRLRRESGTSSARRTSMNRPSPATD